MKRHNQKQAFTKERTALFEGIGTPESQEFKPDPFQLAAIASLAEENDTLVVAPTGTGKTYIAVEGIRQAIAQGKRAIYTAPLKALSNTKYGEFKKLFEPEFSVGLLTGDRKIEGDADVVVATTEIYRNELFRSIGDYSVVILDEFHYLADSQRGAVWEESIILSPPSASLLMLSASISNAESIATWIRSIRNKPVKIISETERPVELRMAFLHPSHGIIPILDKHKEIDRAVAEVYRSSRRHFGVGAPRTAPLGGARRSSDRKKQGKRRSQRNRRGKEK